MGAPRCTCEPGFYMLGKVDPLCQAPNGSVISVCGACNKPPATCTC